MSELNYAPKMKSKLCLSPRAEVGHHNLKFNNNRGQVQGLYMIFPWAGGCSVPSKARVLLRGRGSLKKRRDHGRE